MLIDCLECENRQCSSCLIGMAIESDEYGLNNFKVGNEDDVA